MARLLYLGALWLLQGALAWQLLPPLTLALQHGVPLGRADSGWVAAGELACAVLAVFGATVSLGYPALAAMRHVQRGPQRFLGVPGWAVALAISGAALYAAAAILRAARLWFDAPFTWPPFLAAALATTGLALMSGGALAGELLRRSRPIDPVRRWPALRVEPALRSSLLAHAQESRASPRQHAS